MSSITRICQEWWGGIKSKTNNNTMAKQVQSLEQIADDAGIVWNQETTVSDATYVVQMRNMQLQEAILDHLVHGVTNVYERH